MGEKIISSSNGAETTDFYNRKELNWAFPSHNVQKLMQNGLNTKCKTLI